MVIKCCEQVPQSQLMSVRRLVPVLIPSSFQSWVEPFKKLMKHYFGWNFFAKNAKLLPKNHSPSKPKPAI